MNKVKKLTIEDLEQLLIDQEQIERTNYLLDLYKETKAEFEQYRSNYVAHNKQRIEDAKNHYNEVIKLVEEIPDTLIKDAVIDHYVNGWTWEATDRHINRSDNCTRVGKYIREL